MGQGRDVRPHPARALGAAGLRRRHRAARGRPGRRAPATPATTPASTPTCCSARRPKLAREEGRRVRRRRRRPRWPSVGYAALRKSMSAVDPELRTPAMLAVAIPFNRLTLPARPDGLPDQLQPRAGRHADHTPCRGRDVRVLVVTPTERAAPRPAVLWIHGGGMCVGTRAVRDSAGRTAGPRTRRGRGVAGLSARARESLSRRARRLHGDPAVDDRTRRRTGHRPRPHRRVRSECGRRSGRGGRAAQSSTRASRCAPRRSSTPMLDDRTALRDDHDGPRRADVVAVIQPVGLDRVPGTRAAAVGCSGICGARSARRRGGAGACLDRSR